MKRIVVFGSYITDLTARTNGFPKAGQTVLGESFQMGPGGKGFNQAVAAHRAGAEVTIVTKVGADAFAEVAKNAMRSFGMSDAYVLTSSEHPTGTALIAVDTVTGQNEIIVIPGACLSFSEAEVLALAPLFRKGDIMLAQLETNCEATELALRLAKGNGMTTVLNTAPAQKVSDAMLALCDLVTPNETEAEAISGIAVTDEDAALRAAEYFLGKGVRQVVITLGDRGCFVHDGARWGTVAARKVRAVDTTGAGDAFNGGLVTALSEGKDLWQAVSFATKLASLSVQRKGTALSMPTRAEIDAVI